MFWPGSLTARRLWKSLAMRSLLLGSCFFHTPLVAGDLLELNVTDSNGVYSIDVEMVIHAPVEEVWYVLTDFTHIYRLHTSIIESEILPPPNGNVVRVRTLMNDCVFVFCFDIERVEDVRTTGTGEMQALVVKDLSNIKSGTAAWKIQPDGANSRIHYQGTIEPGFDVFPIIGNYFARLKLRKQMLLTLENIERIARINAGWNVDLQSGMMVSTDP